MNGHNFAPVERELTSLYESLTEEQVRADSDAPLPFDPSKAGNKARKLLKMPTTGNATLDRIVAACGVDLRFGTDSPGTVVSGSLERGEMMPNDPTKTWVEMPNVSSFRSLEAYRAILSHELIHWSKVLPKANRAIVGWNAFDRAFGIIPAGYAEEEMTAEIGAALLLEAIGDDPDIAARALYTKGWSIPLDSDLERSRAFSRALKSAEAAATALLEFAEPMTLSPCDKRDLKSLGECP